jgi:hypothetical protein
LSPGAQHYGEVGKNGEAGKEAENMWAARLQEKIG